MTSQEDFTDSEMKYGEDFIVSQMKIRPKVIQPIQMETQITSQIERKVSQHGSSLGVTIPRSMLEEMGLKKGHKSVLAKALVKLAGLPNIRIPVIFVISESNSHILNRDVSIVFGRKSLKTGEVEDAE